LNATIRNVSSGEPSGRWKLWAKWCSLLALGFALALMTGATRFGRQYAYVLFAAMAVVIYRYRLTKQRLDLLIEQEQVQLTLFMDIRYRVWIEWSSRTHGGRACIGHWPRIPVWLDHEIDIGRQRFNLRIYARNFPGGYMVSNAGRGFQMTVVDNRFCF
jgi:hypothetical protein